MRSPLPWSLSANILLESSSRDHEEKAEKSQPGLTEPVLEPPTLRLLVKSGVKVINGRF